MLCKTFPTRSREIMIVPIPDLSPAFISGCQWDTVRVWGYVPLLWRPTDSQVTICIQVTNSTLVNIDRKVTFCKWLFQRKWIIILYVSVLWCSLEDIEKIKSLAKLNKLDIIPLVQVFGHLEVCGSHSRMPFHFFYLTGLKTHSAVKSFFFKFPQIFMIKKKSRSTT